MEQTAKPRWPLKRRTDSPQARSLVGWWPMAPGGTTFLWEGGEGGMHGTLVNFDLATCWQYRALRFDGIDSVVQIAATPRLALAGEVTLAAWVYFRAFTSATSAIWQAGESTGSNGFSLMVLNDGRIFFTTKGIKDYIFTATATTGVWLHIVTVLDLAFSCHLYQNGTFRQTVTHTAGPAANTDDTWFIGASANGGAGAVRYWLDGMIADLRIYNRVLTAGEIWDLYTPQTRWDLYQPRRTIQQRVRPATTVGPFPPDAIAASTNVSGAVTDIDDDPDSPDGAWAAATSATTATDLRVSFPTP